MFVLTYFGFLRLFKDFVSKKIIHHHMSTNSKYNLRVVLTNEEHCTAKTIPKPSFAEHKTIIIQDYLRRPRFCQDNFSNALGNKI